MQLPWRSFREAQQDREYLALVSYLPLRSFRALPQFVRYTLLIQRQLRDAPGLVGYSLDAKPFSRRFWTLSAWESEEALQAFVAERRHVAAMHALFQHMEPTAFVRWQVHGRDLPLAWADAHKRERQAAGSPAR